MRFSRTQAVLLMMFFGPAILGGCGGVVFFFTLTALGYQQYVETVDSTPQEAVELVGDRIAIPSNATHVCVFLRRGEVETLYSRFTLPKEALGNWLENEVSGSARNYEKYDGDDMSKESPSRAFSIAPPWFDVEARDNRAVFRRKMQSESRHEWLIVDFDKSTVYLRRCF